jgi:hypothetical protein
MNKPNRSWRVSQALALFVLVAAVLIMAAPFRGGGGLVRMQSASVMPLFATASLAHGSSFQARSLSDRVGCSGESLFRSAPTVKLVKRREIVVRKVVSPIPVDFHAPRQEWEHLSQGVRRELDRLAMAAEVKAVEIRATGTRAGDLDDLVRRAKVLGGTGEVNHLGQAMVVGRGEGAGDGEVQVGKGEVSGAGPLALYLVGDFNEVGVTRAQWAALDEVMDYLAMKWGKVAVSVRPSTLGGGRLGLGALFPTERFLRALMPPLPPLNAPAG